MQVFKVLPEFDGSNSYIVTADGKSAVVIDPAEPYIAEELKSRGLVCEFVLLTHGHFDHVGGCGALAEKGARICCGEREKQLIFSKEYLGIFGGVYVPKFEISRTFSDGECFEMCGIKFKALATAGHTAGSVCYLAENALFSGDTLFCRSIGRTDLPTGDYRDMIESLEKIRYLNGDFTLYCGHGPNSSLGFEKENNPYLRKF
ncbi:MAG: MBL fold metallo-hydrolase [Clostridia bacterium]|nr:MBL fold metallo-hydrolase [Clostridia bacterium]